MNKKAWLDFAETFDSLRVFPRVIISSCFIATFMAIYEFMRWYMHLPATERGYEESGAMVGIVLALVGLDKYVWDTYARTGRDWNQAPSSTTTTVATMQTTQ